MSSAAFEQEKVALLRFACTLEKARSVADLRARLMADLGSPYQSFDPLAVMAAVENMGSRIAELMGEDFDGEVTA